MSGPSSSSNTQQTTYNTETYDLSGLDGGSAVAGTGNTVTFSDQGAIEAGRDIGLKALDSNEETTENALAFARDVQSEVTGATRKANQRIAATARDAMQRVGEAATPASERTANSAMLAAGGIAVVAVIAATWDS